MCAAFSRPTGRRAGRASVALCHCLPLRQRLRDKIRPAPALRACIGPLAGRLSRRSTDASCRAAGSSLNWNFPIEGRRHETIPYRVAHRTLRLRQPIGSRLHRRQGQGRHWRHEHAIAAEEVGSAGAESTGAGHAGPFHCLGQARVYSLTRLSVSAACA